MSYLVGKFGKDDSLYPNDPQKRANVDRMLYFDIGTLYKSMIDYFVSASGSSLSLAGYVIAGCHLTQLYGIIHTSSHQISIIIII